MKLLSIDNLDDYKKHGIQYKGIERKTEGNTTLSGAKAFYEYQRAYKYDLKLQGLTEAELVKITQDIVTMEKLEEYAEISLDQFEGFLNFGDNYKGIDVEAAEIMTAYEEFDTYSMTIPIRLVVRSETL